MPLLTAVVAKAGNHGLSQVISSSITPQSSRHDARSTETPTSSLPRPSPRADEHNIGAEVTSGEMAEIEDPTDDQDGDPFSFSSVNYLDTGSPLSQTESPSSDTSSIFKVDWADDHGEASHSHNNDMPGAGNDHWLSASIAQRLAGMDQRMARLEALVQNWTRDHAIASDAISEIKSGEVSHAHNDDMPGAGNEHLLLASIAQKFAGMDQRMARLEDLAQSWVPDHTAAANAISGIKSSKAERNKTNRKGSHPNSVLTKAFVRELNHRLAKEEQGMESDSSNGDAGSHDLHVDWALPIKDHREIISSILDYIMEKFEEVRQHVEGMQDGRASALDVCTGSFATQVTNHLKEQAKRQLPERELATWEEEERKRRSWNRAYKRKNAKRRNFKNVEPSALAQIEQRFPGVIGSIDVWVSSDGSVTDGGSETEWQRQTKLLKKTPPNIRKRYPLWRSSEMQEAADAIRAEHNKKPAVRNRARQQSKILLSEVTHLPPRGSPMPDVPKGVQRWQVSSLFKSLFPTACKNVEMNCLTGNVNSTIKTAEQWGTPHPLIRGPPVGSDHE